MTTCNYVRIKTTETRNGCWISRRGYWQPVLRDRFSMLYGVVYVAELRTKGFLKLIQRGL